MPSTNVVDAACYCDRCTSRTEITYVLRARCTNCGTERDVRYRFGDRASVIACPVCGVKALAPRRQERHVDRLSPNVVRWEWPG